MDAGWNASAKRYPGGKILVANLPNVEIGSTIEVEFEITSTNRPYLAGFETLQFPDALESKSVHLDRAGSLKIQKLLSGPAGGVKEADTPADRRQVLTWTAQKVAALPSENQLPPDWIYHAGRELFCGRRQGLLSRAAAHAAGPRRPGHASRGAGPAIDQHGHQPPRGAPASFAISSPNPSGWPAPASPNCR